MRPNQSRKRKRSKPLKRETELDILLWKVLDGAFYDCLKHHPDYFNPKADITSVRVSMNKRAVGAVKSFLYQTMRKIERRATPERPEG